jgi:hypothetical protein
VTPADVNAPLTYEVFQEYCCEHYSGIMSLAALYQLTGGKMGAIQRYMEGGYGPTMTEWLEHNGMSEIVYRQMQIDSNRQILVFLQSIQESLAEVLRELKGQRETKKQR